LVFGGFMGVGNKLFTMPWEAFEFSSTENKLILNVDREKLNAAPGFEKGDKRLDFNDTLWGESIYNYYDYVPPPSTQLSHPDNSSHRLMLAKKSACECP
jgi:hypothetical protein